MVWLSDVRRFLGERARISAQPRVAALETGRFVSPVSEVRSRANLKVKKNQAGTPHSQTNQLLLRVYARPSPFVFPTLHSPFLCVSRDVSVEHWYRSWIRAVAAAKGASEASGAYLGFAPLVLRSFIFLAMLLSVAILSFNEKGEPFLDAKKRTLRLVSVPPSWFRSRIDRAGLVHEMGSGRVLGSDAADPMLDAILRYFARTP